MNMNKIYIQSKLVFNRFFIILDKYLLKNPENLDLHNGKHFTFHSKVNMLHRSSRSLL